MAHDPANPLHHLVVLGHPSPDSFNAAVAEAYCAEVRRCGQVATLRDLYALGFDPRLGVGEGPGVGGAPPSDVAEDVALLHDADAIILIHPIWFGLPPAIIKGYVDRVFGHGFALGAMKQGGPQPNLAGKRLMVFSSSAATQPWLEERGQWMALRQAFATYLAELFHMDSHKHLHFGSIVDGLAGRFVSENLASVSAEAEALCAELARSRHATRAAKALSGAEGV